MPVATAPPVTTAAPMHMPHGMCRPSDIPMSGPICEACVRNPHALHVLIAMRPLSPMRAATSPTMPPLPGAFSRDVRTLVIQLGARERPSVRIQSLKSILQLCREEDAESWFAIADGAIPPLVKMLGPGTPAEVHLAASAALLFLCTKAENAATTLLLVPSLYWCTCCSLALPLRCSRTQFSY
jgi:hypothetical protein